MNYWGLFRESFGKLLHPTLWLFGLLAALGGGFNPRPSLTVTRPVTDLPPGLRDLLGDVLRNNTSTVIVAGIAISLVVLIFSTFGQAALLSLINRLENGERIGVGLGVDDAGRSFLPLLVVRLLLALPLFIIGAAAAGSALAAFSGFFGESGSSLSPFDFGSLGSLLGLAGVGIIIALIVGGIGIGAERAVVLERQPAFQALSTGASLFVKQIGDFVIIGLLYIVVAIAIGLLFACVLLPVSFMGLTSGSLQPGVAVVVTRLSGLAALWALVFGLIVGALTAIFTTSVWNLAYRYWRPQVVKPVARDQGLI